MNKTVGLIFFSLIALSACSTGVKKAKELKKELVRGEEHFSYTDKNGQYLVRLTAGFNKKENTFFSKRSLESSGEEGNKILEQSVVLSDLGSIKKKKNILRPKLSQYNVWFDGKKYFSEIKMNPIKKTIDVKMVSPESQWNGVKQVKLPSTKVLYCFFSQVIECAKTIGFLSEAINKETGTMNFYIIWEGYPYMNETFTDFPSQLISKAQLEYDGKTKENERRFNLKVAGQSIFFVLDTHQQRKKMFWVSQGISMVSMLVKKSSDNPKENSGEDLKEAGGSIE
jgi:hypothetical protein